MVTNTGWSFCLLGAPALIAHLHELAEHVDGVRQGNNLDAIHDMRVASRRLRSGLAIFDNCLPAKKVKRWKKQFRDITRSLGQARDLDVQILFLEKFLHQTKQPRYKTGVQRLLLRVKQHRNDLQTTVLDALDSLETSRTISAMEQALDRLMSSGKLKQRSIHTLGEFRQARDHITKRLKDMLALEPFILQPDRIVEHHEMRKTAKHLRYTMEYFQPLFPGSLDNAIKSAHKIQRMLGDIHDCDVWVQYLDQFVEDETVRTRNYLGDTDTIKTIEPGIRYLRENRRRQRLRIYRKFVTYWETTIEEKLWENLKHTLLTAAKRN